MVITELTLILGLRAISVGVDTKHISLDMRKDTIMAINISYACNEAYMEQTMVSMISLFRNCSIPNHLHIYFIDMGVKDSSKEEMKSLVESYDSTITIVPFEKIAFDLNTSENTGRHIKSVYAKLFYGRLPGIDRIIYLDSDMVIAGDIKDLWDIELGNNVIAGVETIHTIKDNLKIGYTATEQAINDGMVLMDLKKWRDGQYLEKCLEYIAKYDGVPPVLSEGTINAVCRGAVKIIHPRYNLMSALVGESARKIEKLTGRNYYSQQEIDEATNNPCIIHFLSGFYNRPWCKKCSHPMKNEYLKYRKMTKWADKPLQNKELSTRLKMVGFAYKYIPIELFNSLRRWSTVLSCRHNLEIY